MSKETTYVPPPRIETLELTPKELIVLRDLLFYGNAGADRYQISARVMGLVRDKARTVEREMPELTMERW